MPTVRLAPGPFGAGYQAFDNNGRPLNGGLLNTYVAGSSTQAATYTTSAGSVANANPIVLDSSGRTPAEIWLVTGSSYKFVLTDSLSNILGTWDNLMGINDISSGDASQWIDFAGTPTFIGATSFSLVGNVTGTFEPGLRIRTVNGGGTIYSTIQSSTFGAVTTIVVTNDSGVLDSGISAVAYSILTATHSAVPYLGFLPPGTLLDFAGTIAPTGWLRGDGSNFSRTGYASLFAAIGTTWGVGDGVTTAGLPDTRRRVAMGSGGSGTATIGNAVGNTGGEENHALTLGENGTHSHALSASSSSGAFTGTPNGLDNSVGGGGANRLAEGNGAASGVSYTPAGTITVSLDSLTLANSGSGTGHNTIQPAYIVTKIIKV